MKVKIVLLLLLGSLAGITLSRCGNTGGYGGGGVGQLYVVNAGPAPVQGPSILRFSGATGVYGNQTPQATITFGAITTNCPHFGFLDVTHNRLYLGDYCAQQVEVFDNISGLNGAVTPTRTITNSSANPFCGPHGVAVDVGRDILYVSNAGCPAPTLGSGSGSNTVNVFNNASTINGNSTPNRTISTGTTNCSQLKGNHGLISDPANDRIYVASLQDNGGQGSVIVFDNASTANGSTTPTRAICGSNAGLNGAIFMQLDNSGNLIVDSRGTGGTPTGSNIVVFANAATVNGNVAPTRTISGTNTTLSGPHMILYNGNTDELYVGNAFTAAVDIFSSFGGANGNIAPTKVISGSNTGFAIPSGATQLRTATGVFIDTTR